MEQKTQTLNKLTNQNEEKSSVQNCMKVRSNQEMIQVGGHRAGFDAFMTGYILSSYICEQAEFNGQLQLKDMNLSNLSNSVYLTAKDYALSVSKSAFSKCSKAHSEKLTRIRQGTY